MARYRWVAPPGWPPPPLGWSPPPGWLPDPEWPAAPAGHVFWQRVPRSRWRWFGLVAATVLGVAGVGSCAAAVVLAGPCGFDPPPGDYGELRVINDGPQPVTVFSCADVRCRVGSGAEQIPVGGQLAMPFELCNGDSVAITDTGGVLRGCLVLPVGEDRSQVTSRVSQFPRGCVEGAIIRPHVS
jgi:hypothetical protein